MTTFVLMLGVLLFPAVDDPSQKELAKFDGTWTLASEEFEGKKVAPEDLPGASYTVRDGKVTFTATGVERTATLTVDATKDPKTYDLRRDDGLRTLKGIYTWDGDDLKVCSADDQGERPSDFKTAPGSKNRIRVWKRKK
jgi:uncharacterized protein (TIGR03067 family)